MRAAISIVIVLLSGCTLAEQLEGQPCAVAEDCWGTQACVRTPEEAALDLDGLCLPKNTACEKGQQLGCTCDPVDFQADCSSFAAPERDEYPEMMCDMTALVCVAVPTDPTTATEESST